MKLKMCFALFACTLAACSGDSPVIGKCYVDEDRNPFEEMEYACVKDAQGEYVQFIEKTFNDATKEWKCAESSRRTRHFNWQYNLETAYRENDLCPTKGATP